jgi:MazG family protein
VTLCAPDAAAYALARAMPDVPTQPERPLLARQAAAAAAGALLELTAVLRRECPWDRAQTATSIVPHTIEEAYEVADAVRETGLSPKLIDELGDLLFQTTFLALLCEEAAVGAWVDVALGVAAKLRIRHPWVFGAESAETAGDARNRWEDVKVESEGREGIFHDVPGSLPGLLEARKLQRRAAAIGFDYASAAEAFGDLGGEVEELRAELSEQPEPEAEREPRPEVVGEIGDVLFACVNVARRHNCDPELALRAASARFRERVELAERLAESEGIAFRAVGTAQQEHYYQAAKQSLRKR